MGSASASCHGVSVRPAYTPRLLATAKRYRYRVRLDGRAGWMAGIGAVFTPPLQRGRGFAWQLIEQLLEMERRDGVLFAGLFSEIGTPFYERLGFAAVPVDEVTVVVNRRDGAPAMLVRVAALALLLDVRHFAARRNLAVASNDATTAQGGESK